MKNENFNFILICISYFAIGLVLAGNYIHDKSLKLTQNSVERLIIIEMITKEQFDLLEAKVDRLENHNSKRITTVWK